MCCNGDMYVPKVFAVDDVPKLQDFMDEFNFATVVTERDGELNASHIPFWLDRSEEPYGVLRAHFAVRNPQLKDLQSGSQALVIFQGPHTYVSPSWYVKPENVPPGITRWCMLTAFPKSWMKRA